MRRFSDEMDRAFTDFTLWRGGMAEDAALWMPPIEVSEQDGNYVICAERSYGSFCRNIGIPEGADVEKARAQFDNGVLKVSIPIPQSQRRRREISIEAAATGKVTPDGVATERRRSRRICASIL